jgi:LacI family transcriptional regulator
MAEKTGRVTLRDVAEQCGFSVNTVSRALRGDTKLPEDTRKKIAKAAEELGYIRNNLASGLRSGRSHVIAVIVEEIQNPHYSSLINELDQLLREEGYVVMILCTHNDLRQEEQMLELAISHSVDGIFLFPISSGVHNADRILKTKIPIVLIDREISGLHIDLARPDDYSGAYQAGRYLVRRGHRRLLYLGGPLVNSSQAYRRTGFFDALHEEGISDEQFRELPYERFYPTVNESGNIAILDPLDFTAVFSFNDELAYYLINKLAAAGKKVPDDVEIIGFDNIRRTISYLPKLRTISCVPGKSLAKSAVSLLLRRIEEPGCPLQQEIIPVSLCGPE